MKRMLMAAVIAAALPLGAQAQTDQQLAKGASDTKDVLNYGMGYNLQRYSPLTQINKSNAKKLVPVWNYSYDDARSEESQPLVYDGVIYATTNSATMAIDVKSGREIWKTKVEYPPEVPRIVCCGIINRGAALYDGRVFRTTLDANVIALDAKTGKEVWKQNAINFKDGYAMTDAPLIADGVVITGISGAEYGTRLFLDGWDPKDGKHLWRTYTIPGKGEPGNDTWPGDTWKQGGGSTWITGSFDPELHTVYWGIGNPGPFNAGIRKGDNLYTDCVLALDPKTGAIKWYYQFTPNDPFDYDSVAEMVLADIKIGGKPTKVVMDANRNGFFYVIDRTNGKLLAANAYVKVNWATGVDLKTGRPIETDVAKGARAGQKVQLWPSIWGGKNWEPISFDPKRGMAFVNTLNMGTNYNAIPQEFKVGELYLGVDFAADFWEWPKDKDGKPGPRGYLKAIDPLTGKAKWQEGSDLPRFSGVLSTAGGVVFSGRLTGEFEAFDSDTGKKLWQFKTGSGIEGQPITWEQNGVQYVAVSSGIGGVYSLYSGDERLKSIPAGGSLWVFALEK
jgi:alcohol dehydrogenase (cytochrome c)